MLTVFELDNPAWWALAGPQRELGTTTPLAGRYHPDIAPFGALATEATESHWEDLAALTGPGGTVALTGDIGRPPPNWTIVGEIATVQMLAERRHQQTARPSAADPLHSHRSSETLSPLGPNDVADMLALVAETRPGPFLSRTVEFGGYLGVRREGRLVAMAGERMRLPGFTEISAVATHPDHRRQGLAELLIGTVANGIIDRDETPFLHVSVENATAIRLYESMGFAERRTLSFLIVQSPDSVGS
jgi:ribosomal protein S18 acetylase RimI-like enzyme